MQNSEALTVDSKEPMPLLLEGPRIAVPPVTVKSFAHLDMVSVSRGARR